MAEAVEATEEATKSELTAIGRANDAVEVLIDTLKEIPPNTKLFKDTAVEIHSLFAAVCFHVLPVVACKHSLAPHTLSDLLMAAQAVGRAGRFTCPGRLPNCPGTPELSRDAPTRLRTPRPSRDTRKRPGRTVTTYVLEGRPGTLTVAVPGRHISSQDAGRRSQTNYSANKSITHHYTNYAVVQNAVRDARIGRPQRAHRWLVVSMNHPTRSPLRVEHI